MKIFITGASGFVGSNIVNRLAHKHQFFAMARSQSAREKVEQIGAIAVMAELGKVTTTHLDGCEMVVHAAAFTKEWGSREEFWATTVEGTRQLLDVARQSGVTKFIHISTEAVLFTGQDLNNIDESYPYPAKSEFLYSEAKLEAEKLALLSNDSSFDVSVIRPRLVWGPGDQSVLPILVEMVNKGKFMWINGGINRTSHTHIYNLVEGVNCLIAGWKANQIYFITDSEIHTYRQFLTKYLQTQGVTLPDKTMSKWLIRRLADSVEIIWTMLNLKSTPPLTRLPAYMLSSNFTINHTKATCELGYRPVIDFETAIRELSNKSREAETSQQVTSDSRN